MKWRSWQSRLSESHGRVQWVSAGRALRPGPHASRGWLCLKEVSPLSPCYCQSRGQWGMRKFGMRDYMGRKKFDLIFLLQTWGWGRRAEREAERRGNSWVNTVMTWFFFFSCGKLSHQWEDWKTHLSQNSVFLRICIDHLRMFNIYFFFFNLSSYHDLWEIW